MILGIDLGTSGLKCVIANYNEEIIHSTSVKLEINQFNGNCFEQNPDDWILALETCFKKFKKEEINFFEIDAISFSAQMLGCIILNEYDKPIRPAILWNDGRSIVESEYLEKNHSNILKSSGCRPNPGLLLPKLLWIKKNEPNNYKKIRKILLPKDYLKLFLAGNCTTDPSDASGTMLFDLVRQEWNQKLNNVLEIDSNWLPKIYPSDHEIGGLRETLIKKWNFNKKIKIINGAGDNAAAALGGGLYEDGQMLLTLGTSGVMIMALDEFKPVIKNNFLTHCHAIENKFILESVVLGVTNLIDWYCAIFNSSIDEFAELTYHDDYSTIKKYPLLLPYLSGIRTPHEYPNIEGSIFGLNLYTDKKNIAWAIIEGISFIFKECQNILLQNNFNFPKKITLVGGGAKNIQWAKILSSLLNVQIIVPENQDFVASVGTVRLAIKHLTKNKHKIKFPKAKPVEVDSLLREVLLERFDQYLIHQKLLFNINNL
ncbi:MAG: xylulokinase [SAR324 cluster bacterium]|jgi:xylulokinase|nr:xylulokinase [SAR324 cluster bacterium]MDP6463844.1 xylulokinase [SAR324 cluster bacterium]MDP7332629.1 xylulokinase [SAR324 cluster bacterium]MDP7500968.1 xylulokinase [SAR324 cluster bacterium]|tara:strand:- start:2463 stop:3920 length:1458 start_codon:yes stop_codon:yes gene_type:complete